MFSCDQMGQSLSTYEKFSWQFDFTKRFQLQIFNNFDKISSMKDGFVFFYSKSDWFLKRKLHVIRVSTKSKNKTKVDLSDGFIVSKKVFNRKLFCKFCFPK